MLGGRSKRLAKPEDVAIRIAEPCPSRRADLREFCGEVAPGSPRGRPATEAEASFVYCPVRCGLYGGLPATQRSTVLDEITSSALFYLDKLYVARFLISRGTLHWAAGGIDVYLISTAITPNKIIAGVVLLVVVLAAAGFWMSRRRRG